MASRPFATIRAAGSLLCLALAATGCASNAPQSTEAPTVAEMAQIDPNDPLGRWMPHIREASERFDMPEKWIRAVMMRESGGRAVTAAGRPTTSPAGAIGLMQVMPGTYELMRDQYGLGSNPADPRDNILAGTAYLRQMYDLFGAPGFLAAYNCGPACYAGVLAKKQRMPKETRQYVAALTPVLRGAAPREPSQSVGASAIEVAVVPASAPASAPRAEPKPDTAPQNKPENQPAVPDIVVASAAEPTPAPVSAPVPVAAAPAAPPAAIRAEPASRTHANQPATDKAPEVQYAAAADHGARRPTGPAAARAGKQPSRTVETLVAEALLPQSAQAAAARGERVVIRFVSHGAGGCGSLQGQDRVCVALAEGGSGL